MASWRLIVSPVLSSWVLVILVVAGNTPSHGFKQELWLLFEGNATTTNGNHLYFDSNKSNMSLYTNLLPFVKRYCTRGVWETFSRLNFSSRHQELGDESNAGIFCKSFNAQPIRSLRYFVARDTSIDTIALFPERNYGGLELVYVGNQTANSVKKTIVSLGATGKGSWKLFEGENFKGKSHCYKVPRQQSSKKKYYFNWTSDIKHLGIQKIGSLRKGC